MEYRVWTMQLAKWRVAKEKNLTLIDITVKSGIETFAPNQSDLYAYKDGRMSEEEYTERYIEKMRETLRRSPDEWEALLNHHEFVAACYCRAGVFCHRHIFVDLFRKYLASKGHSLKLMGELE